MNDFVGIFQAIKDREKVITLQERTADELRQEVLSYGLNPEGKSTKEMIDMLAMVRWSKEHPNEPFPEQFEPMLARDASKESEEWFNTTIKSTDWWIQCLLYSCPVYTPKGKVQIGKLKVGDGVLSFGSGVVESKVKEIVKNSPTTKFVKVCVEGRNEDLVCTPNHPIYVLGGTKEAKDLVVGDEVAILERKLSSHQREVLIGTLLGDGSVVNKDFNSKKCSIKFGHSLKQEEYLQEKVAVIGLEADKGGFRIAETNFDTLSISWCSKVSRELWDMFELVYINRKKSVVKVIDQLTIVSFAYWFMDDGSYIRSNTINPNLVLCMQGFSSEDRKRTSDKLASLGFKNNISRGGSLIMDWRSSAEFSKQISQHVPPSMRYKLCDGVYEYAPVKESANFNVRYVPVSVVTQYEVGKPQVTYDITVEPNNNFFASTGFLVHNSKANGMRSILIMDNGKVRMTSRVKSVKDNRFVEHQESVPHFKNMVIPFKGKTVLDGELTSPVENIDTGATISSSKLQAVTAIIHSEVSKGIALQKKYGNLTYNAFDILFYDGEDVREKPHEERADLVEKVVTQIRQVNGALPIQVLPVVKEYSSAADIFKQHVAKGEEGVMLKHRLGKYAPGKRSSELLKMKRHVTVDGWISGIAKGEGKQVEKGLIPGFEISSNVDGKPKVVASVSGITDAVRKDATIIKDGKPTLNSAYLNKVFELIGQEWTKNGLLVHARIVQERPDKNPEDCYINSQDMKIEASESIDNEVRMRMNQLGMELMNLSDQGFNPGRQAELKSEIERIRNEAVDVPASAYFEFRNQAEEDLWEKELTGQISDGAYENRYDSHYEYWRELPTKVGTRTRVVNGTVTNYFPFAEDLLDVVGDRMLDIVHKTQPQATMEDLRKMLVHIQQACRFPSKEKFVEEVSIKDVSKVGVLSEAPKKMTDEEAIRILKELKNLSSYENEDAEYGIYSCCDQPDYKGHKPGCERVQAIDLAIRAIEQGGATVPLSGVGEGIKEAKESGKKLFNVYAKRFYLGTVEATDELDAREKAAKGKIKPEVEEYEFEEAIPVTESGDAVSIPAKADTHFKNFRVYTKENIK